MHTQERNAEEIAKEVNPFPKNFLVTQKHTPQVPMWTSWPFATFYFRAMDTGSISSANTTSEQRPRCQDLLAPAPFPRIAPHPLRRAAPRVTCLVRVSLPGTSNRSFVLFPSPFPLGLFGGLSCLNHPGGSLTHWADLIVLCPSEHN